MRPPNGSSAFASVTAERSSKGGGITISALLANVCYRLVCARHQLEGVFHTQALAIVGWCFAEGLTENPDQVELRDVGKCRQFGEGHIVRQAGLETVSRLQRSPEKLRPPRRLIDRYSLQGRADLGADGKGEVHDLGQILLGKERI